VQVVRAAVATAAVAAVEAITVVVKVVGADAVLLAVGRIRPTSAGDVESWATRLESAKPRQKRTKPTRSRGEKHR
jgi:hypothetical protein